MISRDCLEVIMMMMCHLLNYLYTVRRIFAYSDLIKLNADT